MPGLMRGMARTAAVVGTATATRNAVNRRQADKNARRMHTLKRRLRRRHRSMPRHRRSMPHHQRRRPRKKM